MYDQLSSMTRAQFFTLIPIPFLLRVKPISKAPIMLPVSAVMAGIATAIVSAMFRNIGKSPAINGIAPGTTTGCWLFFNETNKTLYMESVTKSLPKGTTQEQWDAYHKALKKHEDYCESMRPVREMYLTKQAFDFDTNEWYRISLMDTPNKPGYTIANND